MVKLLRYYGTKALRSNCLLSNVGWHYYVDRKTKRIDKIQKANYNSIMMNYKSINKNESGANSKELNVLTSYRLNDFKKKAGATHVDMSANIRRAAFTLAEVLITLGIIGVVAAMTIPTLVSNYKKKVVETKLVNFYSVINNAVKMSEVENGSVTLWDPLEQDEIKDDSDNVIATPTTNVQEWFAKYLAPYVKTAKVEKLTSDRDGKLAVYFNDGSLVLIGGSSWFFYPESKDFRSYDYDDNYTDIDKSDCGIKFFTFYFNPATANDSSYKYHKGKGVEPYMGFWDGTLDDLKNNNRVGCKENVSTERAFCTKLIQLNNWKIPDDYPVKF